MDLIHHKGYGFIPHMSSVEYIDSLQDFRIRDNDVFLVSYPKAGTTWMQQIIISCYELVKGKQLYPNNAEQMPWLEFNMMDMQFDARQSPRLFTSHLLPHLMPPGVKDKKVKMIYLMRNVKDNCISLYHFYYALKSLKDPESFDQFLEDFLEGKVVVSSWFDHIRAWHSAQDQYNILFVTYEEMKQDLKKAVRKICSFLELHLSDTQMKEVLKKATFEFMKKEPKANYDIIIENLLEGKFMRKDCVGDWKDTFTVAQSERVDRLLAERLGDLNLEFIWE